MIIFFEIPDFFVGLAVGIVGTILSTWGLKKLFNWGGETNRKITNLDGS